MPLPLLPGGGGPSTPIAGDVSVRSLVVDQGGAGGSGPPIVYRPGQGQPPGGTVADQQQPIEQLLRYGSPMHQTILARLNSRRDLSQRHIGKRYDRWDEVDEHCRMFIDLSRRAKKADGSIDSTKAEMPFERAIVVPMSLAILTVRLTQLLAIFGAREPFIQLEGRGPEDVQAAKMMEALLGYDFAQMSAYTVMYAFCQDAEKYGLGVIHDCWEVEQGWKMQRPPAMTDQMKSMLEYMGLGGLLRPQQTWGVTREYNRWEAVDPFHFWPDPRAPVSQVQQGEFVGHRIYRGAMHLKERSVANGGIYFNLDYLPKASGKGATRTGRNRFDLGDFQLREAPEGDDRGFYGLDSMQVKLIPSEWKLGPGTRPEIWRFGWVDETCIVRAHPDGYAHGQFSYSVGESVPDEHASFNPGNLENLDGIQRTINWLVNSHVENVRKHINDAVIYDPSLIEEADLLQPGPSRHIRITALMAKLLQQGQLPINGGLMQLPWVDVTKGHLQTVNALFDMAQRLAATSDPQMSQTTDDERTLGEVQQVIAGSSARLATTARMLDAQAITPLAYRSISNRQQFTELDQFVRIAGDMVREMGGVDRLLIRPSDLGGSFDYIPHSGTVPPDPARFAQVWVKMLEGAGKIPQLSQPGADGKVLDVREIFNEAAKAMGVKNVQQFWVSVVPDPAVMAGLQAGNLVPTSAAGPNGQVPGAGIRTPLVQGADLTP